MEKINNIKEAINFVHKFSNEYRGENLEDFLISDIYDLSPIGKDCNGWPNEWPNNGKYGVYLIMDAEKNVIYIGESTNIGKRLSDYFQYSDDRSCKIVHNWSKTPRFVCTISVDSKTWFERLALEEYLIYNIQPEDNIKGK